MKLTSIVGTGTGKLGGSVFSVRNGAQIIRAYQPIVANPQSEQQVAQRAKLKLASQLSAVLAREVAPFGRDGLRSPRNLFVKDLFERGAITHVNNKAEIDLKNVRLTSSRVDMLGITTINHADGQLVVSGLVRPDFAGKVISVRVVLVSRSISTNEPIISLMGNATISQNNTFSFTGDFQNPRTGVVYIYAIIPSSDVMIARYGGMTMTENAAVLLMASINDNPSGFLYSMTIAEDVVEAQ